MSTSNYPRILQLGRTSATHLMEESYVRTFATAKHLWDLIERSLADTGASRYDILEGWNLKTFQEAVPTVGNAARLLRTCLHQWSAEMHFRGTMLEKGDAHFPLQYIATMDAQMLLDKGLHYGDSWKKRGGIGAFMMLARKWDRLLVIHDRETAKVEGGASILDILSKNSGMVQDDVTDLRGYLLLVEDEVLRLAEPAGEEPGRGYVRQDPDDDASAPFGPRPKP